MRGQQSGGEEAAQALHSVLQGLGGVVSDGCRLGLHPSAQHSPSGIQWAVRVQAGSPH